MILHQFAAFDECFIYFTFLIKLHLIMQ